MGYPVQYQGSTLPLRFLLVLASDHITGATGKTPTVTICKSGGTFASPSGTVTEIGNGWYSVAGDTNDVDTLGPLLLHATASACDPCDDTFDVVNYDPTSFSINSAAITSPNAIRATALISEALVEIGVIAAGTSPDATLTDLGLKKLTRLLDNWNAVREAVYASTFNSYTLTPSLQPHTIGPTGTFVVASRPVTIEAANIVLTNTSPSVRSPLNLRDDQWWMANAVPGVETTLPTDLYYDAGWPDGALYLWPVPTAAYDIEILTRTLLSAVELTTLISYPPGYLDALILTLAEELCGPLLIDAKPSLKTSAARARARIFANNQGPVPINSADWGMPSGRSSTRSGWNYLTGGFTVRGPR